MKDALEALKDIEPNATDIKAIIHPTPFPSESETNEHAALPTSTYRWSIADM